MSAVRIKLGTARRLGLRQPPTSGLLEHPKPMTEQEFADLKARWRAEHGVIVLTDEERDHERGVTKTPPLRPDYDLLTESRRERRRRLGLRWWQREAK